MEAKEYDFNKVFKSLIENEKFDKNPKVIGVSNESVNESIDKLIILGFANMIEMLNGDKIIELTSRGKHMYNVTKFK